MSALQGLTQEHSKDACTLPSNMGSETGSGEAKEEVKGEGHLKRVTTRNGSQIFCPQDERSEAHILHTKEYSKYPLIPIQSNTKI